MGYVRHGKISGIRIVNSRWLSAFDARQLIASRRGISTSEGLERLEYAIIDYARTVLPARCQFMWEKILRDDELDQREDTQNATIPEWVWDLVDFLKADWQTGIFHLAGERGGELHYVKLVGLEFSEAAIDRIWPAANSGAQPIPISIPKASNAGRRRQNGWNDWIAYLVIAAPDIMREEGPEALIDKVAALMAADGLPEMPRSTIQPAAQAVIKLLENKQL